MEDKKTIPVLLYGQIRGIIAFDRFHKDYLNSKKYNYEFYLGGWNSHIENQIKLPFKNKILVNEKELREEFVDLTHERLKNNKKDGFDLTAARISYHYKNLKQVTKNRLNGAEFCIVCRSDYFLNLPDVETHLDDLFKSDINLLELPFISLKNGLAVISYFQAPTDGFFLCNMRALDLMFEMYDNVFHKKELEDIKIDSIIGPHQTVANYIVKKNIKVITNNIDVLIYHTITKKIKTLI